MTNTDLAQGPGAAGQLRSRAQRFLKDLEEAAPDRLDAVAETLFRPAERLVEGPNGFPLPAAASLEDRLQALGYCLHMLQSARQFAQSNLAPPDTSDEDEDQPASAGSDRAGRAAAEPASAGPHRAGAQASPEMGFTLTTLQFNSAWAWLKEEFQDKWLHKEHLQQQLASKTAGHLTRKQTAQVNGDLRGAFEAWFDLLAGDSHFGKAILRHGHASPAALSDLLNEYQLYIDSPKHAQRLREEAIAEGARARLRCAAIAARQDLQRGHTFHQRIEAGARLGLSSADRTLLMQFRQGELDRRRLVANAAYGSSAGASATSLSIEAISNIKSSKSELHLASDWDLLSR